MSAEMNRQAHTTKGFHKVIRTDTTTQGFQQRSQIMNDLLVLYGRTDLCAASQYLDRMIQELYVDFRENHPSLRADGKVAW